MSEYLIVSDFRRGLDVRKFALGAPAGTLVECNDGHLTNAGDIEKRKGFPKLSNGFGEPLSDAGEEGEQAVAGPATFGMQATAAGLLVFGSALPWGTPPTQSQPVLQNIFPSNTTPVVAYQQLPHPAVTEGATYNQAQHRMTAAVWSELFGGLAAVIAQFTDGRRFLYYDGALVADVTSGLILPHLDDVVKIATHLARIVNLSAGYTGEQLGFTTGGGDSFAWAAGMVTVTLSAGHGLTVGAPDLKVTASGVDGWAATAVALAVINANQLQYPLAVNPGGIGTTGLTLATNVVEITGADGVEYEISSSVGPTGTAGTFSTFVVTLQPVAPRAGIAAAGSFKVMGGSQVTGNLISSITVESPTVKATGTIDSDGTTPVDNSTVTIGGTVYTFVTAAPAVDWQVKIDGSANAALQNLKDAINNNPTVAGKFQVPSAHPTFAAGTVNTANHTLPLTALVGGTAANGVAITGSTSPNAHIVAGTTAGGVGTSTQLLAADVQFTIDNHHTAVALVNAINAYSATSGYTAEVGADAADNQVQIFSSTVNAGSLNDYKVSVVAGGNVCIGDCLFSFSHPATTGSVTALNVGGVDVLGADITGITDLAAAYATIEAQVNAGTSAGLNHGIIAFATATYVQLSKKTTTSADLPLTVDLIVSGIAVTFAEPPTSPVALSVTVPNQHSENLPDLSVGSRYGLVTITATPAGGSGVYSAYHWQEESAGSGGRIRVLSPDSQSTRFYAYGRAGGVSPGTYSGRFVCVVTDSFSQQATSNTIVVTFIIT